LVIAAATVSDALSVPCPGNPCPDGFQCIGRLYGEAAAGQPAYHGDDQVVFPAGFRLDQSYQQSQLSCFGGGNNNCGDLKASDIPKGIHVIPDGSHYWAVLKEVKFGQTIGPVVGGLPQPGQFTYGMHLYCGPEAPPGGGCNVHVDVCAKKLK